MKNSTSILTTGEVKYLLVWHIWSKQEVKKQHKDVLLVGQNLPSDDQPTLTHVVPIIYDARISACNNTKLLSILEYTTTKYIQVYTYDV